MTKTFLVAVAAAVFSLVSSLAFADTVTTKDGQTFDVNGDMVSVIQDGKSTPATDGTYTLTDGTTLKVEGGKKVAADAQDTAKSSN